MPSPDKKRERGFVLIVTALSIITLVAFVGLVFDTGYLAWMRERAQTAADSAVMGAMLQLKSGNILTYGAIGQSDAAVNGFTNGANNTTVAINVPPVYGSYAGNTSYVEAVVQKQVPNIFMAILGQNTTWVGARATARVSGAVAGNTAGCIYALDPTASRALSLAGSNTVTFNCSAFAESTSSSAYYSEGSITLDLSHTAKVGVVGGYQINNGTKIVDDSTNQTELPATVTSPGDPFATLAAPSSGTIVGTSPSYYDMNAKPANNTIQPGVYCGGLKFGNTNGATYKMNAGTYIMAGGGFVLGSQATIDATAGVTIYNTSSTGWGCASSYSYQPINIDGQAVLNINAPTSGTMTGIAMFQDRTITSTSQNQIVSQTTSHINGALYFPHSPAAVERLESQHWIHDPGSGYDHDQRKFRPVREQRLLHAIGRLAYQRHFHGIGGTGGIMAAIPKSRRRRGSAVIEFALSGTLLFMLFAGLADLTRMFYYARIVTNAARAGVPVRNVQPSGPHHRHHWNANLRLGGSQ